MPSPLSHTGRQTNRWTSGPWPGLIPSRDSLKLRSSARVLREGDGERQRGSELCWPRNQAGGQTALRHVAVGTSGPKGEWADSECYRTPSSEWPAGVWCRPASGPGAPGRTGQLALLPELCSGVIALEAPGGAGTATVQTLRPPQTCPSETPPSCILNKLSLVTLTHTDV